MDKKTKKENLPRNIVIIKTSETQKVLPFPFLILVRDMKNCLTIGNI